MRLPLAAIECDRSQTRAFGGLGASRARCAPTASGGAARSRCGAPR